MDSEWLGELDGLGDMDGLLSHDHELHSPDLALLDDLFHLPPHQGLAVDRLRCLDTTHPAACQAYVCSGRGFWRGEVAHHMHSRRARRCTPPPSRDMRDSFELPLNGGIKALRTLLLMTPEWGSDSARKAVADEVEAEGDPEGLAPLARRKRARELNKGHLLELCFRWGYKSNIWALREGRIRRRARQELEAAAHAAAAAAPHQQQQQLMALSAAQLAPGNRRLPIIIDGQAVREFVDVTLAGFLSRSAAVLEGPAARDLAVTRGVAYFQPSSLQEYRVVAAQCKQIASTTWTTAAVAQRAWAASIVHAAQRNDTDTTCAWQVLPLAPNVEPLDAVLQQLQGILAAGEQMRLLTLETVSSKSLVGISMMADEFKEGVHKGMAFLTAARLLRAQLASSGLTEYAAAADQLLQVLISYAAAVGEAYLRRLEWSSAAMSNGVQLVNTHSDNMTRALNELEENLDQTSRGTVLA